jgi:hypothetical protein
MQTWNDLKSYVRANYKVDDESPEMMRLTFGLDGGRRQIVFLFRAATQSGTEWVQIESPIGSIDRVPFIPLMRLVAETVCGGVSSIDDMLVYRHAVPLADMDVEQFEAPLRMVTGTADNLERHLLGLDVV